MKFLNHLDLFENEARRLKMYRIPGTTYTPSINTSGNIILDTATNVNIPKWWDSTGNGGNGAWRDFSYNTTGGVNTTYTYAVPASTTKLRLTGSDSTTNDVEIFGGTGGLTVARTNANKLTINGGQYTVGIAAPTTAVSGKNVSIKLELNGTALDEVGIQGTTYISNAVVNAGTFSLGLSAVDGTLGSNERFLSKSNKWVTLASMQVTYGMMTSTALGLGKLFSNVTQSIGANAVSETTSRTYGVQKNSSNQLVVNVPWEDTTIANTVTSLRANNTGTYRTGNINLVNGSNVTITETSAGVFNFAATNTQIAARLAGVGLTLNGNTFDVNTWGAIAGTLNATTGETAGKYYKVHTDANDKLIVNVPWENTTTNTQNAYSTSIPTSTTKLRLTGSGAAGATTDDIEFVGSGATSVTRTNDSKFTIASTNSQYTAGANVTLIGGAFSTAGALTNQSLGLAKTAYGALNNTTLASMGSEAAGRVYGIQKNTANQLVVQVPWSDTTTNTQATYTLPVAAGAGNTAIINLTGGGAASGIASAVTFSGTANEVAITESVGNNGTITIGLPDDVTIGNDLTVTNDALVSGDLTVTGDLTVNGTTTTLNTSVLEVEDNFVEINKVVSGASAANTANFGVTGERGSLANVSLKWIESSDTWFLDESNTNQNAGGLVSKKIIQEIWRNVSTDSGTASHTQHTTNNTLSILGSNGITTSATGQAVTVSGSGLATGTVMTLSASSIGSASNKRASVTHALNTKDVIVRTYLIAGEGGTLEEIYTNVTVMSTTVVKLEFSAQPEANVRVVITAVRTPIAGTSVAYA